ncbi:uncharacterized protein PAC_00779 [Phialocephala subalpina]|uniref:Uncharacterized protein n=1 Tax=Phialocephala subalpina TaxID=576137 RepID=A0A1L7WDP5_9HELO|nr:uncharacterized protein PAC_00779 [Phialocephala subalpina]
MQGLFTAPPPDFSEYPLPQKISYDLALIMKLSIDKFAFAICLEDALKKSRHWNASPGVCVKNDEKISGFLVELLKDEYLSVTGMVEQIGEIGKWLQRIHFEVKNWESAGKK